MHTLVHQGTLLQQLLKDKDISVLQVAREFGISRRAVYDYYKSENISNKVCKRFLDTFDIDLHKHLVLNTLNNHTDFSKDLTEVNLKTLVQEREIRKLKSISLEKDKHISSLEEIIKDALIREWNRRDYKIEKVSEFLNLE